MPREAVLALAVAVLVIAALILLVVVPAMRRHRLHSKFGPEYDRAVEETGSRREAEHVLAAREKRHAQLELHELDDQAKDNYIREWRRVQEEFVDAPERAATEAGALITAVMAERGYPTGDYEQQAADLSVEHAGTLSNYREAHRLVDGHKAGTSTEDLRQAMVAYRMVFEDLVGAEAHTASHPGGTRAARS